jgi:hypothetical protein
MISDDTLHFLLENALQQSYVAWEQSQPPRNGLHASSVLQSDGDWCVRQHALAEAFPAMRQPKDAFWKTLATLAHGWSIHEKWQYKLLKRTGLVAIHTENSVGRPELDLTHVDPLHGIHYSPDVILNFCGLILPIEIKGINTQDFQGHPDYYDKDGQLLEKGRPGIVGATLQEAMARNKSIRSAVPQVILYMGLLGVTRGAILVEDKNTQDFQIWIVQYDPTLIEKPLARAKEVQQANDMYVTVGVLPERVCGSINDPHAKRCPFAKACFSRKLSQ